MADKTISAKLDVQGVLRITSLPCINEGCRDKPHAVVHDGNRKHLQNLRSACHIHIVRAKAMQNVDKRQFPHKNFIQCSSKLLRKSWKYDKIYRQN